ncbi:hypothetical protein Tco_0076896, partial [Tanacetum coccineum]
SDESVGSPPSRVILFGDIPTVIPSTSAVAPETSTIAPVTAPPGIRRRSATLIRPGEAIPFGRPYTDAWTRKIFSVAFAFSTIP